MALRPENPRLDSLGLYFLHKKPLFCLYFLICVIQWIILPVFQRISNLEHYMEKILQYDFS